MNLPKCPQCNTNPPMRMINYTDGRRVPAICNECSVKLFGALEKECELAWGCKENCLKCNCTDVKKEEVVA